MFKTFKQLLPISLVLGALAVATPSQLVERQTSTTCAPLHMVSIRIRHDNVSSILTIM